MNIRLNQFTLKGGLAKDSFGYNFELQDKKLIASPAERYAVFFSRGLDSGGGDMTWNRLSMRAEGLSGATYTIRARAGNEKTFEREGHHINVDSFLGNAYRTPEEKFTIFQEKFGGLTFTDSSELLLYRLRGRYLWVAVEIFYGEEDAPVINDLYAEFPAENFIEFLPEVYQENSDFTSRFLAVPGMEFTGINNVIDHFADNLDLSLTAGENLPYLSTWIGAEEKISILPKGKIRDFLKKSVYFSSIKGTPGCIKEVTEFIAEGKAQVAERHNFRDFAGGDPEKARFLENVLPDEDTFAIILEEKCFSRGVSKGQLGLFINYYKPATSKYVLVFEKKISGSDKTYFDLNLGAGDFMEAKLDNASEAGIGKTVMEE